MAAETHHLELILLPERFAISRLAADSPIPAWGRKVPSIPSRAPAMSFRLSLNFLAFPWACSPSRLARPESSWALCFVGNRSPGCAGNAARRSKNKFVCRVDS